jgi:hypothetical protein
MKKVSELKLGDKIELLNGSIGVISKIKVEYQKGEVYTLYYENGWSTYCLANDEVETL